MSDRQRPTVSISPCTADDVMVVQARERQSGFAQENFALHNNTDYFFLIARLRGQVAGYVVLDARAEHELAPELKWMLVYPEFRRNGVGLSLATAAERYAAERGFEAVNLCVDPDDPVALPLYIGLDYGPTGDHHFTTLRNVSEDGTVTESDVHHAIFRKSLRLR